MKERKYADALSCVRRADPQQDRPRTIGVRERVECNEPEIDPTDVALETQHCRPPARHVIELKLDSWGVNQFSCDSESGGRVARRALRRVLLLHCCHGEPTISRLPPATRPMSTVSMFRAGGGFSLTTVPDR